MNTESTPSVEPSGDRSGLRKALAWIALLLSLLSGLSGVFIGWITTVGEDFQTFGTFAVVGYAAAGALLLTGAIGLLLSVAVLRR